MSVVYEHDGSKPLGDDVVDGMDAFVADDVTLSTDWDIAFENPPHSSYDGPNLLEKYPLSD